MKPSNETPPASDLNALRVKVAELCGYTQDDEGRWYRPKQKHVWHEALLRLPDYPSDLNACAEFEKIIEEKELCVEYVNTLRDGAIAPGTLSRYGLVHATATQRCEAFVKVIEGAGK